MHFPSVSGFELGLLSSHPTASVRRCEPPPGLDADKNRSRLVRFYSISVALYGWAAKADDSLVCFGAKPDKGFLDMKSRCIWKWEGDANESWLDKGARGVDGGPGRGSWRWTAERREERVGVEPRTGAVKIGSSEEDRLKMSAFVEFSLVTHASDSPHMHIVLHTFLCSWLTPSFVRVCSFVLLFSPFSQSYSCLGKEMCVTPSNH